MAKGSAFRRQAAREVCDALNRQAKKVGAPKISYTLDDDGRATRWDVGTICWFPDVRGVQEVLDNWEGE